MEAETAVFHSPGGFPSPFRNNGRQWDGENIPGIVETIVQEPSRNGFTADESSQSTLFQQKPLYTKTSRTIIATTKPGTPKIPIIRKNSIMNAITKRMIFKDISRIFFICDHIFTPPMRTI